MIRVNDSMAERHRQFEDAKAVLDAIARQMGTAPDDSVLIVACKQARQRYLDASLALMQSIDPPAPAVEVRRFRYTTGCQARQFRSSDTQAIGSFQAHRESVSGRHQHRRRRMSA